MDLELTKLASDAASILIKALTTEAWDKAKSGMTALWRRVHPDRIETIQAELEETRAEALEAHKAHDEGVEQDLVHEWMGRLRRLLASDPNVAVDLRRLLVDVLQPALAKIDATSVSVTMQATAVRGGRVNQAGRDQHITNG